MTKDVEVFFGRIFLSCIFIFSILGHIIDPSGIQDYMAEYGMPATAFFLVTSLVLRILGTLSVLLGYRTSWGVGLLTLFLIPATLIFHTHFKNIMETIGFFENVSLQGGLLLLSASGPGRFSLDRFRIQKEAHEMAPRVLA